MTHKYKIKKNAIEKARRLGCLGVHKMSDDYYMPCKSHAKYLELTTDKKDTSKKEKSKGEIDELVDADGTMLSSKIPILDPHLHPKKTMDQTIAMTRNVYDIFRMGYRRYFYEEDMSKVFGREEDTDFKSFDEIVDDLTELLGIDDAESKGEEIKITQDAIGRAEELGADPNFKGTKKRLYEKENDVKEDVLVRKNKSNSEINKKEKPTSKILKKNLDFVKKMAEKEGISINELVKMLKSE
jgi:hypothetical protein